VVVPAYHNSSTQALACPRRFTAASGSRVSVLPQATVASGRCSTCTHLITAFQLSTVMQRGIGAASSDSGCSASVPACTQLISQALACPLQIHSSSVQHGIGAASSDSGWCLLFQHAHNSSHIAALACPSRFTAAGCNGIMLPQATHSYCSGRCSSMHTTHLTFHRICASSAESLQLGVHSISSSCRHEGSGRCSHAHNSSHTRACPP
jgi:hypothetical protein